MKILVVCTGNSCRSQMAEGFLKSYYKDSEVFSAGIKPEKEISIYAVEVMKEAGIDIAGQYPESIEKFKNEKFDFLITFSESAKNGCEKLSAKTKLHFNIPDPFDAQGNRDEILKEYRLVRDEIFSIIKNL